MYASMHSQVHIWLEVIVFDIIHGQHIRILHAAKCFNCTNKSIPLIAIEQYLKKCNTVVSALSVKCYCK